MTLSGMVVVRNTQCDEDSVNHQKQEEHSVVLLESWCGLGQRKEGVEKGAHILLQTLQSNHLPILKITEEDRWLMNGKESSSAPSTSSSSSSSLTIEEEKEVCLNQRRVGSFNHQIAKTVTSILSGSNNSYNTTDVKQKEKPFIVNIGGDHSVAIGSIYAMLKMYPDLRVLWIDAHADINTPKDSMSKNMHGMPLAFLAGQPILGEERKSLLGFEWMNEEISLDVSSNRLAYIGLRDVDEFEQGILDKFKIMHFTASKVHELGIDHCLEVCFSHLGLNQDNEYPLFLSFDVDGIDPEYTPSTGTAVENGISHEDGLKICKKCAEYSNFVGMDLVEVNPGIGSEEQVKKTIVNSLRYMTTAIERKI